MRADALEFSADALARLANKGLVKRAERDIAEGNGPEIVVTVEAVRAKFTDGTVAELLADLPVEGISCTCGAKGWCRHRIAMILACQSAVPEKTAETWSPGSFTDEDLGCHLGSKLLDEARKMLDDSMTIRLDTHMAVPTAKLPTCSVSFLSSQSLQYAKCSCSRPKCAHVALAVWAFRQATDPSLTCVNLGKAAASKKADIDFSILEDIENTCIALAAEGVVHTPRHLLIQVSESIRRCDEAGWCWMQYALQELVEQINAWTQRHASYQPDRFSSLICEVMARCRVARGEDPVLAGNALGIGVPMMTKLARTTLSGLGAKVEVQGDQVLVRVYLVDGASGDVVFLEDRHEAQSNGSISWKSRRVAPGVHLGALATGSTISEGVRRYANHSLSFTGKKGATQTGNLAADWKLLCQMHSSLGVSNVLAYVRSLMDEPPHWLRPRDGARDVRILWISDVDEPAFDPGSQELVCRVFDQERSAPLFIRYVFHPGMPNSVDRLAQLLKDRRRPIQAITGILRFGPLGMEIVPIAVDNGSIHVLCDTDKVEQQSLGHPNVLDESQTLRLIERSITLLDRLHHQGVGGMSDTLSSEIMQMSLTLSGSGFSRLGSFLFHIANDLTTLGEKVQASIEWGMLAWSIRDEFLASLEPALHS